LVLFSPKLLDTIKLQSMHDGIVKRRATLLNEELTRNEGLVPVKGKDFSAIKGRIQALGGGWAVVEPKKGNKHLLYLKKGDETVQEVPLKVMHDGICLGDRPKRYHTVAELIGDHLGEDVPALIKAEKENYKNTQEEVEKFRQSFNANASMDIETYAKQALATFSPNDCMVISHQGRDVLCIKTDAGIQVQKLQYHSNGNVALGNTKYTNFSDLTGKLGLKSVKGELVEQAKKEIQAVPIYDSPQRAQDILKERNKVQ